MADIAVYPVLFGFGHVFIRAKIKIQVGRTVKRRIVEAYQFSMLGLSFDIVGAFMVAVEAIKLENLRAFRDRILNPMHAYTLSPRITWIDAADQPVAPEPPSVPADRYPGLFMGLHYIAGLASLALVNRWLGGRIYHLLLRAGAWVLEQPWYVVVVVAMAFVLLGVVGGLWMIGELVHVGATRAVQLAMRALDFIDARTPDGTVGVLGFALLVVGFLLQMYGAYLGGHR